MQRQLPVSDPFALLMDPERVVRAMEQSERLGRLQRRLCCPLDNPVLTHQAGTVELSDDATDVDSMPSEGWR